MNVATQPESRGRAIARRVGLVAGLVALAVTLVLGPLVVRAWIDGRAQLRLAAAAAQAGELDAQILHLGRAARWRVPLASHDDDALAQLRELGASATEAGDPDHALAAWRELRSALLGTRAVSVVDPELLREANAAIVQLMVDQAEAAGDQADQERWAAELNEDTPSGRSLGRSLLAAACFAAWLCACIGFFVFGIEAKGRLEPRPALRWGGAALVLMTAWILLM